MRFEAAAERARSLLEVLDAQPLLHDRAVYVHLPEKARKLMAANVAALKRVLAVLGAKVRRLARGGGGLGVGSCAGWSPWQGCRVQSAEFVPQRAVGVGADNPYLAPRLTLYPACCQVAPPKSCNLCIVVGGGARPPHIPKKALCVKEEWLLQAAERFELPALEEYALE